MENLTTETRVAWLLGEPRPEPGHEVLVFDVVQGGKVFRERLAPGQPYKAPWREKMLPGQSKPVAYAVNADQNLRHRFSGAFPTREKGYRLPIEIILKFRVDNAVRLGETLASDPLRQLEDETRELIVRALRSTPHQQIYRHNVDVEELILSSRSIDSRGEEKTYLDRLKDFAAGLGLRLDGLSCEWRLPASWEEEKRKEEDITFGQQLTSVRHQEAKEALRRDKELVGYTLDLENQLERTVRAEAFELQQKKLLIETATNGLRKAIANSSDRIDSIPELSRAIKDFLEIPRQLEQAGMLQRNELALGGLGAERALPALTRNEDPMIERAIALLELCSAPLRHRRKVLSSGLHVLAEALRETDADRDVLVQYSDQVRDLLEELIQDDLSEDQFALLRSLAYPDQLSADLIEVLDLEDGDASH